MLDESIYAYIVLRTLQQPEDELKFYAARTAIDLVVQAYGLRPRPSDGQDVSRDTSPARNEDVLWSGSIDTSKEPVIIAQPPTGRHPSRYMLAIWKTNIPLSGSFIFLYLSELPKLFHSRST